MHSRTPLVAAAHSRRHTLAVIAGLSAVLSTGAPPAPAGAVGQSVGVTWSSDDGTHKLAARPAKALASSSSTATDVTINVDPGARYQQVLGEGGVLESSSVHNIVRLSPAKRDEMMSKLFDPRRGNSYDIVRLPMGCPDMCAEPFYTYDDMPAGRTDTDLSEFSIRKDLDAGIVSVAKQALSLNPNIRFYMSMWSAPAWMKSNGDLKGGGEILPQYYPVLARYQRRAIQAYQAQGIPIHALTPQNEPLVHPQYPSGAWTGAQMREYVKVLGPELQNAGLATEIWVGDDNPPSLRTFVPPILDDPAARRWVDGVAVHDYTSDEPSVITEFAARYPDVPVHLTERSYYGTNGEWTRHDPPQYQRGMRRLIDFWRNGITSWTYWITFLDTNGQPNHGPLDAACCTNPFTAPPGDLDSYTTNRDYYLYGQLTRFVRRGARVVGSDQTSGEVSNVAFRNADGTIVVVVANGADSPRSITIRSHDGVLTDTLPALTVATYRWAGGAVPTDPRVGTFRIVNKAQPDQALHGTGDRYLDNPVAQDLVTAPAGWNDPAQRWAITSAGDGYYRVTNRAFSSYVAQGTQEGYRGIAGAFWAAFSLNHSAPQFGWEVHDDQLWRIVPAGDGTYRFLNKDRDVALAATYDAYGGFTDVFQSAVTPGWWDSSQQRWTLQPA